MPDPNRGRPIRAEWVILDLLLERSDRAWELAVLVDAIGSPIAVAEALEALQAARLIERSGAFVRIARE